MIYLLPISGRVKVPKGAGHYHLEAPHATIITIQRPFTFLSSGPLITSEESFQGYRKWLFRKLLVSKFAIEEFTHMLDVLMQEGDLILQCSCVPPKLCHGTIIKDALTWAEKFGIEEWHNQLKKLAASSYAKRG